jgi:hypothetical protein
MQTSACSHILIELADDVTTYFQRVVRQSAHGLAENDRRRVRLCPEHPWAIATEHIRAIICVFSILFNLYTRMLYCLLKAEVEASQKKKTSCVRNHHGFLCPRAEPRAVYDDAKIDEMLRNHHFGNDRNRASGRTQETQWFDCLRFSYQKLYQTWVVCILKSWPNYYYTYLN